MYFKVLMEIGHLGSGKSYEVTRYIESDNAIALLSGLKDYPALKSKHNGGAIKLVQPVSQKEFEKGALIQQDTAYNQRRAPRYSLHEQCVIEKTASENGSTCLNVTATNFSSKGIGIRYDDNQLPETTEVFITIKSLNIINKRAKVLWSTSKNGISTSGLVFL